MQGNKGIHTRLDLIIKRINIMERMFVKDACIMKKRIFLNNINKSNSDYMDKIDHLIDSFEEHCVIMKDIVNNINKIPLDKLTKQFGSKDNVDKEERESASI